jgi:sugar phosphate permease
MGMKGNDFNIALTLFWVAYIVFEMASLVACKYFGPGWFLPATIIGFGTACLATGFANNMAQVCGLCILLGFFEAPVLGGIAYYYSRWYTQDELTFRLGICSVMGPLMCAFSGLAASAILTLDRFGSMTRWRMILGIEGVITLGIGVITFFTFTDRPETARWHTPEEKILGDDQ